MPIGFSKAIITANIGSGAMPVGQQYYQGTTHSSDKNYSVYYWTVPDNVTLVSVVLIGGGGAGGGGGDGHCGGGGGGLTWGSCILKI